MATISVKERDLSWYYRQRQRGNLVVYMPGLSTFGPYEPVYVYEDTIKSILGGPIGVKNDYSYYMAESLTKVGIDVLFQRIDTNGTVAKCQKYQSGYKVSVTCHFNDYMVEINNKTNEDIVIVTPEGNMTFEAGKTTENGVALYCKDIVDEQLAQYLGDESKWVVTTNSVIPAFTITIDGKDYAFASNDYTEQTTTYVFDISQKTAVDNALSDYSASSLYTIVKEDVIVGSTVKAKYAGSLGNKITLKFADRSSGIEGLRYANVYLDETLVEQFTVNFADPLSKYYYENIQDSLNYVAFEFDGELIDDFMFHGDYKLEGGSDYNGADDPIAQAVLAMASADSTIFDAIKDPYGYYFDVITNGGLYKRDEGYSNAPTNHNFMVDLKLAEVAETTGTSVYLIGGGEETTEEEFFTYCGDGDFTKLSFTSAIGPWCYSQLISNGSYVWLPGWYAFLVAWGNSVANGTPVWYAPAGVQRARVGSVVRKPKYEIGNAILDKWQNQSDINFDVYKLNPIMNLKQYGYCVYGNSTLLANKPDGSTSMLQSLGTRVLVNQIKAKAFEVALGLQFDQLTDNLFMAFKVQMGSYMDMIKYQGGLYDYEIVIDRTTVTFNELNQRTVPVMIRISPNPAAEKFNIMCEVYPAGVTFTDEFDETSVIA